MLWSGERREGRGDGSGERLGRLAGHTSTSLAGSSAQFSSYHRKQKSGHGCLCADLARDQAGAESVVSRIEERSFSERGAGAAATMKS